MPLVEKTDSYTLYHGSCLQELKNLPDESVDSVNTDPPYGFDPLNEDGSEKDDPDEWDQADPRRNLEVPADRSVSPEEQYKQRRANSVNYQMDEARHDQTSWGVDAVVGGYAKEKGLIALPRYMMPPKALLNYQLWCAMWASEALRVLKPGGHLVAFNGTKTYHRMAVGIEDAGFELRDTVHWTYGKGHVHGVRPWQAMDRAAGFTKRKRTEEDERAKKHLETRFPIDVPQSEEGKAWEGWHTGLKPSHELVGIFRKPFNGPIHKNLLKHGVGAYHVDACMVPVPGSEAERWPANTILTHSPGCGDTLAECCMDCPVAYLEAQHPGASAYFTVTRWEDGEFDILRYVSKPGNLERHGTLDMGNRNTHPTVKPIAIMAHFVKLVTPAGGHVLDSFAGSGSTGVACIRNGFPVTMIERSAKHLPTIRQRCGNSPLPLFSNL